MGKIIFKHNKYTNKTTEELFWEKVDVRGKDECWEWLAATNPDGYGRFYPKESPRGVQAHRYSWELHNKKIAPKELNALHECDNPACVNPNHIFLGTQKENIHDMINKGRMYDHHGERNSKAKLTEDDVREIKRLRKDGFTYKGIAKQKNVTESCVSHILNGRHWAWVS